MAAAPARRAAELARILERANRAYYELDAPEISDAEYDRYFRELQQIEEAHPQVRRPDSPTLRVGGAPASSLRKHPHRVPMFSLANAFSPEELDAWEKRNAGIVPDVVGAGYTTEIKIDGAAVSLTYERGRLRLGASRGGGERRSPCDRDDCEPTFQGRPPRESAGATVRHWQEVVIRRGRRVARAAGPAHTASVTRRAPAWLVPIAILSLAGCAGQRVPPSPPAPLSLTELKNATYRGLEGLDPITLTHGRWQDDPSAEGVARRSVQFVRDFVRSGDLDGDGADESVVLLAESSGGSGEKGPKTSRDVRSWTSSPRRNASTRVASFERWASILSSTWL